MKTLRLLGAWDTTMRRTASILALALALLLLVSGAAQAVVLHPTDSAGVPSHPDNNVVVRWANSSGVVVDPNWILTAAHTGVASSVTIGANTYNVAETVQHPTADLRLARLESSPGVPANLADFVSLYTGNPVGQTAVLGGWGQGNGGNLVTSSIHWGYTWNGASNNTQRWGQNRVDATQAAFSGVSPYVSDLLIADFDALSHPSAVPYESALALYDSGGGWFINDGGVWKLTGISAYVTHSGYSAFADDPSTGVVEQPDLSVAVRVSSYASFINNTVPEPSSVLLAGSGLLMLAAVARRRLTRR